MNKILALFAIVALCFACANNETKVNANAENDSTFVKVEENIEDTIPQGAKKLMQVYPEKVKKYVGGMLLMADGDSIPYDDGKKKGFIEMLDNSDPEDMFTMQYKVGGIPEYLSDAGRSRSEQLFKSMYGSSESKVRRNLVQVEWFGRNIPFTTINGAADSLRAVATELRQMPQYHQYLTNSASFYWRKVRGANRQSAHSYGIAIDINTTYSNYWLWECKGASETDSIKYNNRIPEEIVLIFEKHGFIWGGGWYHFDTMHFEFRPELLK